MGDKAPKNPDCNKQIHLSQRIVLVRKTVEVPKNRVSWRLHAIQELHRDRRAAGGGERQSDCLLASKTWLGRRVRVKEERKSKREKENNM